MHSDLLNMRIPVVLCKAPIQCTLHCGLVTASSQQLRTEDRVSDWSGPWSTENAFTCFSENVKILVAQLCPTLCNPTDCNPPGSPVCEILQARILEWETIPPGDLPDPGIEPGSPALQVGSLLSEPPGSGPRSRPSPGPCLIGVTKEGI